VHHAGDLDRFRVPARRPRGVADEAGRLARLGRRHQVEDHAVGDPARQGEHPRPERAQPDRQAGPHRRAVQRDHPRAEQLAVVAGAPVEYRTDDCHVLLEHPERRRRGKPEPGVHHRVAHAQAKDKPAACRLVELRRGLGRQHRRPQGRVGHRGAHRYARGRGGHRMAQRQSVAVPLGHEHRAEPGLLGGRGHVPDRGRRQPAVRRDRQTKVRSRLT
jgi:hypothetical protein